MTSINKTAVRVNEDHQCGDFESNVGSYLDGRKADSRYTSFDYCFNYFQSFRETGTVATLAERNNVQVSCLQLGFYLASWGMFRGSASILQKSARCLTPVIETIARVNPVVWEIDAHCYTENNIQELLDASDALRESYPGMSDILVTKIMLGVFGNVPAFDRNFKRGFGVSSFGRKALRKVGAFCLQTDAAIARCRVPTLDFQTGEATQRMYSRAKVIDMAFFIVGAVPQTAQQIELEKRIADDDARPSDITS